MKPSTCFALLVTTFSLACGGRTGFFISNGPDAAPGGSSSDVGGAALDGPASDDAAAPCGNLDSDPNNCGACGHACTPGACSAGRCQPALLATVSGSDGTWGIALSDSYVVFTTVEGALWRVPKEGGLLTKLIAEPGAAAMSMRNRDGVAVVQETAYYALYYGDLVRMIPVAGGPVTDVTIAGPMGLAPLGSMVLVMTDRSPPWTLGPSGSVRQLALLGDAGAPGDARWSWSATSDGTSLYFARGMYSATDTAELLRAPLSGGPLDILLGLPATMSAGYLRSDATSLYWVMGNLEGSGPFQALSLSRGGGAPSVLATDLAYGSPIAVDDASLFYFADGTKDGREVWSLQQVPKAGGASTQLVAPSTTQPHTIAVDARAVYWTADSSVFMVAK